MGELREIQEEIFVPFFEEIARGYKLEVGHFEPHKGKLLIHLIWVFDQRISERRIVRMFPKRLRVGSIWYFVLKKAVRHEMDEDDGSWWLRATLEVESENDRLLRNASISDAAESSSATVIQFSGRA